MPAAIEHVLRSYLECRRGPEELFSDFVRRHSLDELKALFEPVTAEIGSEDVQGLDGGRASFREALLRDYSIRLPSVDMDELLSRCATNDDERSRLCALAADESGKSMGGYEIIDLLAQFPSARPAPADFVAALSPLQPRLYSICSSQSMYPDQVHLTVGVVSYANQFGRSCRGVASGCLGERMRPGQRVRIYVQKSEHFRLPHNDVY